MSTDAPSTAKPLTAVEGVKELSRHLRGSLAAELHDGTDHFSTDSTHLVKFHGFYQQALQQLQLGKVWMSEG